MNGAGSWALSSSLNIMCSSIRNILGSLKLEKPSVIFVLGPPGSGKGTLCDKFVKTFDHIHHLSAGELLRAEITRGSEYGTIIDTEIKEGRIVPVEITVKLLENAMREHGWTRWFLIDGFPRNLDNLTGWNKYMNDLTDVKSVLYIKCSEKTCVDRIMSRAEASQRTDDNIESLRKRFLTYQNSTLPIINHYIQKGIAITVSGELSPNDVYENSLKGIEMLICGIKEN